MKTILQQHISNDRIDAVIHAIQTITNTDNIQEIELLTGGYSSSKSYKLKIDNHLYVLRVMGLDQALEDRLKQIECFFIAADENIAPHCFYADAESGIVIMKYIEPQIIDGSFDFLGHVANKLYHLHSLEFPDAYKTIFTYTEELEASIKKAPLSDSIHSFFKKIDEIKTILAPHLTKTACHNDLNPNNFIFDGNDIFLIDWEAACAEDRFFDLAAICNFFIFEPAAEDYFLVTYFGREPFAVERAKLYLMRQISYYFYALHFLEFTLAAGMSLRDELNDVPTVLEWTMDYQSRTIGLSTAEDFLLYAHVLIQSSLKLIQDAPFAHAIKVMGAPII